MDVVGVYKERICSEPHIDRHVLVVDDDRDFADTTAHLLRLNGYKSKAVYKSVTVERALREFPAQVVLTDIRMDERSGLKLIEDLRSTHPKLMCVMMTAYASLETAINALQEGAYDYLCKPFHVHDLLATLDRCFEKISLEQAQRRADLILGAQNVQLEIINIRLQQLLEGMQVLSKCSSLQELCIGVVAQLVNQTSAVRGTITLQIGDGEVLEHTVNAVDAGTKLPPAIGKGSPEETNSQLQFPVFGEDEKKIGTVVVHGSRSNPLTQRDREFGEILLSYAREVIRVRQMIDRLSRSEARLREILDHSPSLISLTSLDGRFIIVNSRFLEWHDVDDARTIGATAQDLFPPETAILYAVNIDEMQQCERIVDQEVEIDLANGSPRSMLVTRFLAKTDDGQPVGIGTIATDVTEHRAAEARMRQFQKMEALGQLTGGIAHDFNNLLAVIVGNLRLIGETSEMYGDISELVEDALAASQTGTELTHRLLAFSRTQALRPQATDVGKLVREMTRLLDRTLGGNIEINQKLSDNLWPISVDRSQLETSILNLSINARDAMPEGGILTIKALNVTVDQRDSDVQPESTVEPKQYVVVSVSDTGIGMTAEVVERAIQPFFTTKSEGQGSGLGLSMVYGFANQSGGYLEIDSSVECGTTAKLFLPRSFHRTKDIEAPQVQISQPAKTGEHILVVEDKADLRRLVKKMLTPLGYNVLEAANCDEALAILESAPHVDLLFADVVLPGGFSGVDLARKAQSLLPGLRVLYTSGYAPEIACHTDELLLKKPYQKEDLAHMVRQALSNCTENRVPG